MSQLLHPPDIRRRNQYNSRLLYDALKCVLHGKMNCHQASIRFKIPRSTIQRKLNLCREQHRMALELQLRNEMPSSSSFQRSNEMIQQDACEVDLFRGDRMHPEAISFTTCDKTLCQPFDSSCERSGDLCEVNTNISIETTSNLTALRLPMASAECQEQPLTASDHLTMTGIDRFSEDQIEYCGEEQVIGEEETCISEGLPISIDDDTMHMMESNQLDVMYCPGDEYTEPVMYEDDDFVGVNHMTTVIAEPTNDYNEHLNSLIAQQADTEEEELERAADRLSEAFRSVPSRSKLRRCLNPPIASQHAYASQDFEQLQPQGNVVLPRQYVVLRRQQPNDEVYMEEPRRVQEMVTLEEVHFAAQHI